MNLIISSYHLTPILIILYSPHAVLLSIYDSLIPIFLLTPPLPLHPLISLFLLSIRHSGRIYPILATVVPLDTSHSQNHHHHQLHQITPTNPTTTRTPITTTTTISTTTTTPLSLLISCCSDEDPSTRKFACFAIGNAAFHSDSLYVPLAHSIGPLALASETEADEKTRANAVGAIGNLVRNCGSLATHMVGR